MDRRFYEILDTCTVQVRVGDVVKEKDVGPIHLTTIDAMPAEADLKPGLEVVDMILLKIGVDKARAVAIKAEFVELLQPLRTALKTGPSYIALGALVGDQGAAFQTMALGQVLGLWTVVTPKTLGMTDAREALDAAGRGYVMTSGYRDEEVDA